MPTKLPEIAVERIRRWAGERIPIDVRDEIRLDVTVRGGSVTVYECRPPWRPEYGPEWSRRPVAQLRHAAGWWSLHCADRNGRWHLYPVHGPSRDVHALLEEIDRDPICTFWG